MNLRQHKGKLAAGAVIISLLVAIVVWLSPHSASAVRLTFLYETNHPQVGKVGVFELVNHLNESVSSEGGYYRPAKRIGLNAEVGDFGARILGRGRHQFAAGTTNMLQLWSPTNGGPYKVVLQCWPASKSTPAYYSSARVRVVSFVSRFVKPSPAMQASWYGSIFAESQSFEPEPQ